MTAPAHGLCYGVGMAHHTTGYPLSGRAPQPSCDVCGGGRYNCPACGEHNEPAEFVTYEERKRCALVLRRLEIERGLAAAQRAVEAGAPWALSEQQGHEAGSHAHRLSSPAFYRPGNCAACDAAALERLEVLA